MDKEKLKELITQALAAGEEIRQKYAGKPGEMTGPELERWEKAMNDADSYKAQLALLQRNGDLESWASEVHDKLHIAGKGKPEKAARGAYFRLIAAHLIARMDGTHRYDSKDVDLVKQAYQINDPAGGGLWQVPQEISTEILTLMKDLSFIRAASTVVTLPTAGSLGVPAIDTDPSDADWTSELSTGNPETTLAAGKRELSTNALAKQVKLSKTLVRKVPNFEDVFLDRLMYKAGITEEKAFLTGDGNQKPLGVFVASTKGISTNRDVPAANSNAIGADDLINVQYSLKAQYRREANWLLHRTVIQVVRKLKDENNNYLWATGLGPGTGFQGAPSTLLGLPVWESEYAPNTITTGLYTALLGCFRYYWIADALDMTLQPLYELYAASNQIGYILRKEMDGMPVQEEAFARLVQP